MLLIVAVVFFVSAGGQAVAQALLHDESIVVIDVVSRRADAR